MLTQEQFHELRQYVPDSEMVKMVYAELHKEEEDFKDWDEAIQHLVKKALGDDGDIESLFNLLELTFMSGHNEGMLEATSYEESSSGES